MLQLLWSARLVCNNQLVYRSLGPVTVFATYKHCAVHQHDCKSSSEAQVGERHQRICCCEQSKQLLGSCRPNPPLFSAHISQIVHQKFLLPLAPADSASLSQFMHCSATSTNSLDSPRRVDLVLDHIPHICASGCQPTGNFITDVYNQAIGDAQVHLVGSA